MGDAGRMATMAVASVKTASPTLLQGQSNGLPRLTERIRLHPKRRRCQE